MKQTTYRSLSSASAGERAGNITIAAPVSPLVEALADRDVDVRVVRGLLRRWANPNVRSETNTTPLEMAMAHGRPDLVKVLLRYGARADFPRSG